ncbi:hypothetical protein J7J58_00970, partial [candidate division WOR-3 bacterium]|nr:hypothetical protein [candidate division WOR-3 bacterium]
FKGESKTYKIVDIIRSHEKYLNKYFDIILERIENILKEYNKQISRLEKMINNNKDFENIVILTSQIYENIFQQEYLYSPKILIECKKREKEHERYKYAVNHFLIDLKLGIQETKSDIFNYNTKIIGKKEGNKISHEICVVFTDSGKEDIKIHEQKNYNYIMEKLYSKQIKYDFSYIENKFKDYPNMLEEINNMKININNDLEYYASYNYLRSLLTKEKLLKD